MRIRLVRQEVKEKCDSHTYVDEKTRRKRGARCSVPRKAVWVEPLASPPGIFRERTYLTTSSYEQGLAGARQRGQTGTAGPGK